MSHYITRKNTKPKFYETVDEFSTKEEAEYMLKEYKMSDPEGLYYTSALPCDDWEEEIQGQLRASRIQD